MIRSSGTLEERVAQLLVPQKKQKGGEARPVYRWVRAPARVLVEETEAEGEAALDLGLPDGTTCLVLHLPTGLFGFLAEDKNADGALLLVLADGSVEAHICECKKTVDSSQWTKALRQMTWTLVKLRALAAALGEQLAGAVFYTAFREDSLAEDSSPNPAGAERIVGVPESAPEAELDVGRRNQLQWMRDGLRLRGFEGAFRHHKIKLDPRGAGAAEIAPAARS